MNLLIVDDNVMNLKLLRAQLEAEAHSILEATDGVEALKVLDREIVDGIISDILMPNMDGISFLAKVKEIQPEATRILLTGYADKENSIPYTSRTTQPIGSITKPITALGTMQLQEKGLLNIKSPLARALIGKDEGDTVEVKTPGGQRGYEILSIKYV